MSRLIESIRLENGKFGNLAYHEDRMKRAWREIFEMPPPFSLGEILVLHSAPGKGLYKCRVVYNTHLISVTFIPYEPKHVTSLKLIHEDTISYKHKFEDRRDLDSLFRRRENCDDILIVSNGFITDSSYANVAFRKGNQWLTSATCLLPGTMRQKLIDEGKIREAPIKVEDLSSFDTARLMNSMLEWNGAEIAISSIVGK
jgi:4-amino-4-deoxychorismate lyase